MQKVWSIIRDTNNRQAGLSVLEVILAATVFGFLTVALSGAIIYGRSGTAMAGDRQQAIALADEGIEAVRNIRDAAYSNFPADGTYGLAQSGSPLVWNFSGSSDTSGIFSRQITISTVDSTHKLITSTVTWTTASVSHQVASTARLSNWRAALPATGGPIMMAYSKTTTTPFYRIWAGTSWGTEGSALAVTGNINYVVLKSARTRNEAVLGTQDASGTTWVQVWNGTTWGNRIQLGTTGSTTTRSFDIAYEKNGDRAIVAYNPATSADFSYRIWDGNTWSNATSVSAPPTTGSINWIEMAQNPISSSNEISLMLLDATTAVYGMTWNGNSWGTMGVATTWDTTTASSSKKCIAVAYEQTSGRAMFMWGDSTATNQNYRIWNGTTLNGPTVLTITDEGGIPEWLQLAARPSSNELMFGVQDAGADLNTRKWSGSAWDTLTQHVEHDASTENIASMNFDIVWETLAANAGKAWLLWGDGATTSAQQWSGSAWGSTVTLSSSDDTSFIRLKADPSNPNVGTIFSAVYDNSTAAAAARDITTRELSLGASTWPARTVIWSGPTSADPVFFRVDIAVP